MNETIFIAYNSRIHSQSELVVLVDPRTNGHVNHRITGRIPNPGTVGYLLLNRQRNERKLQAMYFDLVTRSKSFSLNYSQLNVSGCS